MRRDLLIPADGSHRDALRLVLLGWLFSLALTGCEGPTDPPAGRNRR